MKTKGHFKRVIKIDDEVPWTVAGRGTEEIEIFGTFLSAYLCMGSRS